MMSKVQQFDGKHLPLPQNKHQLTNLLRASFGAQGKILGETTLRKRLLRARS